ncbi:polysaccharide biosynthesis tyrosine autokinase [Methylotenera sp.]|uniref:polysaccharide biosynthesis tyrosine autokinase n=1 Tax=Methylotenera sp. TaxID=2051956 RepID=UPI00248736B8|nr:polysaccharide biosynthesis tyrosine autokinase [Methylotenera sp.]MDI1297797.1 hypothetical protein [Methylotenera sp.]
MNQNINQISLAEKLVDSQTDMFSFREVISRIFLRPRLFLFALLTPPIIAVLMTSLVPLDWTASTKILIRYSATDTGLLKNLVSEGGLGISGATSAELIKSKPVLEKAIKTVGITNGDLYQSSTQVISNKVFGAIGSLGSIFSKKDNGVIDAKQASINETGLINTFKASLESSSKKSGGGQAIEILEKTSQVPESMKLDELITLQVKSFNREKVDNMANGLAAAFIDEYYSIYAQEAKKQTAYLDTLVAKELQELARIEKTTPADFHSGIAQANSSGRELISKDVPLLANMATQLMEVEADLTKARQIYAASSPQVTRLSSQVENLKFMLKKQERIEISKQLLEQLKTKRYQALNTENVYKNKLVPISIAEYADEPAKAGGRKLLKLMISGIIGITLGCILAISSMVVLNVLDPRLHFRGDVEKLLPNPIVSYMPMIKQFNMHDYHALKNNEIIHQGIWQLITRIGEKLEHKQAKVITISSASFGEGVTFIATALAMNLAKNKKNKICLIDANFVDGKLSQLFKLNESYGLIEALLGGNANIQHHIEDAGLFVVGAGKLASKTELGYYATAAAEVISEIKSNFDYIIIDAGSALKSNEALVFSALADESLMVAASGVTRKSMLRTAVEKLESNSAKVTGIIFNQSKEVLPAFIYNML